MNTQTPAPNSHVHPLFAGILNAHAAVPANATPPLKSAAQLQTELQAELQGFDPAYAYSDDHTFWREQLNKATRIGELRRQLAQGVVA